MALEAGSVFVRLGALFKKDDFAKWDAAVDAAKAKAKDPVEVKLDAKTTAVERKIAVVQALIDRYRQERASATLDVDTRNIDRKITEATLQLKALKKEASSGDVFGSVARDAERAGVKLDSLASKSSNARREINLLGPAFSAAGSALGRFNSDLDSTVGRLAAASRGAGGPTGLGGVLGGAFSAIPAPIKAAPALLPAGLGLLGGASALTGSLGAGILGAGALGVGALGVGGVGLVSLMSVLKPAQTEIKKTTTAWDAYTKAVNQYGAQSKQAATAQAALNAVTKNQDPVILETIKDVKQMGQEWSNATKPAQGALAGILDDALKAIRVHMKDISGVVNDTIVGIRRDLAPIWHDLFGKQMMGDVKTLGRGFVELLKPGLQAVMNLMVAFGNLAVAVLPHLQNMDNAFLRWTEHVRMSSDNSAHLSGIVDKLVSQFDSWMRLIGALGRVLFTFFGAGAAQGQTMVDKLTQILNKWNEWMKSNPDKMKRFFSESVQILEQLLKTLAPVVLMIGKLSGNLMPALLKLLQAISPIVIAVSNALAAVVSWLVKIVSQNPALRDALGIVVAIGVAWKAISLVGQITGITKLIGLYKDLKTAAIAADIAEGAGGAGGFLSKIPGVGRFFGRGAATSAETAALEGAGAGGAASSGLLSRALTMGGGRLVPALAAAYLGYQGFNSIFNPTTSYNHDFRNGLGSLLVTSAWTSSNTATRGMHESTNVGDWLSGVPLFGSHGGQTKDVSNQITQLQRIQKELKGITSPAQLSAAQIEKLYGQLDRISKEPGLNPKVLAGVKALMGVLEPSKKRIDDWNHGFNQAWLSVNKFVTDGSRGIATVKDRFDTNMRLIAHTVGLNSEAGRKLLETNIDSMIKKTTEWMDQGKVTVKAGLDYMLETLKKYGSDAGHTTDDTYTKMYDSVKRLWEERKISETQYLDDIRRITQAKSQQVHDETLSSYRDMFNKLQTEYNQGKITHQQFLNGIHRAQSQANQQSKSDMSAFAATITGSFVNVTKAGARGMTVLIDNINRALRLLGVAPLTGMQVEIMKQTDIQNQLIANMPSSDQQGALGLHHGGASGGSLNDIIGRNSLSAYYGGGLVPGREFGYEDNMVLVDPNGVPRAKMAGDEGIVTRHQMPEINTALSFAKAFGVTNYGSLPELWSGLTRAHGYARGGQLPGFASGGSMSYGQIEGVWEKAGGPASLAAVMAAIAEAESSGQPGIIQQGQPYATTGWGLWQITPGNSEPQYGVDQALLNPLNNARAALAKYHSQGLGAWTTFTSGAYRRFLQGNVPASAYTGAGGAVPTVTAPHVRGPRGISQIINAGLDKVAAAGNRYIQAHAPAGGIGGGPGTMIASSGKPADIEHAMMQAAAQIMGKPYIWGGGHGSFDAAGYDCSGAVSYLLHAAGFLNSPVTTDGLKTMGDPGPGKYITWGVRGTTGSNAHTMISFFNRYLESGGGGPYAANKVHWDPGWDGAFSIYRHPPGFARGGLIGDFGEVDPSLLLRSEPRLADNSIFRAYADSWQRKNSKGQVKATNAISTSTPIRAFQSGGSGISGGTASSTPWKGLGRWLSMISGKRGKHYTGLTDKFRNLPNVAALGNVADPYTTWANALENQYSLVSNVAGTTNYAQTTGSGKAQGTTLNVGDITGFNNGDSILIYTQGPGAKSFSTTVSGSPSKGVVTLADPLPSNFTNAIVYNTTGSPHLNLTASDVGIINVKPILPDVKGLTWPNLTAGENVFSAELADKGTEVTAFGLKINAWQGELGKITAAETERRHRLARIERVLALDYQRMKRIEAHRQAIQRRIQQLSNGTLNQRLAALKDKGARDALIVQARDRITQAQLAVSQLRQNIADERRSATPDKALIAEWEAKIGQEQALMARDRAFIAGEQQSIATANLTTAQQNAIISAERSSLHNQYSNLGVTLTNLKGEMSLLGGSSTRIGTGGFVGKINTDLKSLDSYYKAFRTDISDTSTSTIPGLELDIRSIREAAAQAVLAGVAANATSGTGGGGGGGGTSSTGATDPAAVAQAALADLVAFQGDLANLFKSFGSNFVPAGQTPAGSMTGMEAGMRYYGAAGGSGNVGLPGAAGGGMLVSSGGGTTIHQTNHFGGGPPDPLTYASQLKYNLQALVGG